jgi:hypothetical protein
MLSLVAVLALGATVSATAEAATAAPDISGVSKAAPTRSDRLVVTGSGFGAAASTSHLMIAGLASPFTRWRDTSITAYVPEAAPLGSASVQVVTAGGSSDIFTITVMSRRSTGRIAWRFEMDSDYARVRTGRRPA